MQKPKNSCSGDTYKFQSLKKHYILNRYGH